jgi:hypothetical protein
MAAASAFTPSAAATRRGGPVPGQRARGGWGSPPTPAGYGRPGGIAAQIKEQRRGYARAVLQGVARTYRGRPAAQVATVLRQALSPLGVRLSPVQARELAAHIEAGRPVELP